MKWILIFLIPAGLFFTSCQNVNQKKMSKQIFRAALPFDPLSLDPRKGADVPTSTVNFMMFEGLTRMTPASSHELAAASNIRVSDDCMTYTFHLRDSAWSNGDPVTAYDFAYAWTTMLDPKFPCPNANLLYPIKNAEKVKKGVLDKSALGIRVLDDKTLEVKLERPTPYFLDLTSFCVFFPVPHKIAEKNPKWSDHVNPDLITNGPFKLVSWKKGDELIFEKNDLYWDAKSVSLDGLKFYVINNELTVLNMFLANELDFVTSLVSPIPSDWIPDLNKRGLLKTHPVGASTFFAFNTRKEPFSNKHIRKAFAFAVDRKSIVENVTQANELVATGCIPPMLKRNKDIAFFEDGAAQLAQDELKLGLQELGIDKSALNNLVMHYFPNNLHKRVALALQQQWRQALGVEITLEEVEFKVFMNKLDNRDFDIAQVMWIVQYNDQMNVLDRFKLRSNPKNYPDWENPEYVRLLEDSAYAKSDDERYTILEQAEALITEELPLSCIFHWNALYLLKDNINGFFISPVGSIHFNKVEIYND